MITTTATYMPVARNIAFAIAPMLMAFVVACTGTIGTDDGGGGQAVSQSAISPGAAPLRRLTQSQYNNTVRDLLGDTTAPANAFPPDETVAEFSNSATSLTVSPLLAQGYQTAAEALATNAIAHKETLLPCDPATVGEDACAEMFIRSFGRRAYRRPLSEDEVGSLTALYAANHQGGTFEEGIQSVIEAMLQSASFLYRVEYGVAAQGQAGVLPLDSNEIASRLSYFLWNSMPDDALFAVADSDGLQTPEQIAKEARRMIGDPKAHDAVADFFEQWLNLKGLNDISKDAATYPDFSDDLRVSMQNETRAFIDYVMWQADGRVETLLTSNVSFLDANTAKLYGVRVEGSGLTKMILDPTERAGILTQPSVLAIFAKPNQSSPILRGKLVRERFLCQPLPPPPANLVIVPPEVTPGATTRERFAEHDTNPACAGCHKLMDPIGFGFEHYDGIGKFRSMEEGFAVDSSGQLSASDVDGAFDGVPALAQSLAQSKDVKECIATEWFRYAFGRGETQADNTSLATAKQAFADANYDMRELLIAFTQTAAFRYRLAVTP